MRLVSQFTSKPAERFTTLRWVPWEDQSDEVVVDGFGHFFESSDLRFAQAALEVARYRRGLP
jgi:predicted RNA-binding protein with PUA domain